MNNEEFVALAMKGEVLKNLDRTGWILAGVDKSQVESVAEHSFGASLISLLLARQCEQNGIKIDISRVLSMAVLHDLAESEISDVAIDRDAPDSHVQLTNKVKAETQAMSEILRPLGNAGESLLRLWDEIQKETSLEARVVVSSDILDMLIHAVALERGGMAPSSLAGFFESSRRRLERLDVALAVDIYKTLYKEHESNLEKDI
ncbi:MAG: HD family hydrolase [Candidatus Thorarchaeota archaeon]